MDAVTAIRSRKSIRGFRPDPVSREVLAEVLEVACRAPSAMNTQPWEFFVVAGEPLKEIARENVRLLREGRPPAPEHPLAGWPRDSVFRRRQVELAKQLFALMGIEREDKEKRAAWMERGFRYFDAPAAVFVLVDKVIAEPGPLMDIGAVLQTFCIAARARGLGTCIEDQGIYYPEVLRRIAGIPESKRIVMAVAVGYPDEDFPANRVETSREPVEEITTWVGFDS